MKRESLLFWPRHRSRAREDLISSMASTSLEGEEDLISSMASTSLEGMEDLISSMASTSLEGEEDLSVLLWPRHRSRSWRTYLTCTGCLRSRRDLLWVSLAFLNTWNKSHALVPTPMERAIQQCRIIHGVSKTPRQLNPYLFALGAHA